MSTRFYFGLFEMKRGGCVYIMTNKTHAVLYIGVTSDLLVRTYKHKDKHYPNSFTTKYNCDVLVYYVFYPTIEEAIAAETALKKRGRAYKIGLVSAINPDWKDLYENLLNA